MRNNRSSTFVSLFLASSLFLCGLTAIAQEPKTGVSESDARTKRLLRRGFHPAQIETVELLPKEIEPALRADPCKGVPYSKYKNPLDLSDHPILVGRNVAFSKDWLAAMSDGLITPAQFTQFRNIMDRVYDSYEELVGGKPPYGKKVLICFNNQSGEGAVGGHKHERCNCICINSDPTQSFIFFGAINQGALNEMPLHELAHAFGRYRNIELVEDLADVLVAYALESNKGLTIATKPTIHSTNNKSGLTIKRELRFTPVSGTQYRLAKLERMANSNLKSRNSGSLSDSTSIYKYYLLGMADKAGWGAFKKAFRSLDDESYKSRYRFSGGANEDVAAVDFLMRIAEQSRNPERVLHSLPDNGRLLKEFKVDVVPVAADEKE